jgi:hypothetical protein
MTERDLTVSADVIYASAGPNIIGKLFDGELTLINLDTGQYFAAGGCAADIWELVADGAKPADIVNGLQQRYKGDAATISAETNRILELLLQNALISVSSKGSAASRAVAAQEQKPWQPGWIEVYGDMKELLLLDPIHDVDEAWPKARQENAN